MNGSKITAAAAVLIKPLSLSKHNSCTNVLNDLRNEDFVISKG